MQITAGGSEVVSQPSASQPEDGRDEPWKEAAAEEILRWPFTSVWGGMAPIPEVCGHPCDYRSTPKMPNALMHLSEKLHVVHCGKEEKGMAVTVGWSPLGAVPPATDAQLEAEA